jgi:hypothetical protein
MQKDHEFSDKKLQQLREAPWSGAIDKEKPIGLRSFQYFASFAAISHIALSFASVPMYSTDIIRSLVQTGILISPTILSTIVSALIITLSFSTLIKRSRILRILTALSFGVLCIASLNEYSRLSSWNMVWQWDINGPSIPQAPFALLMGATQFVCVVLLFLPKSSEYFKN